MASSLSLPLLLPSRKESGCGELRRSISLQRVELKAAGAAAEVREDEDASGFVEGAVVVASLAACGVVVAAVAELVAENPEDDDDKGA
jgi:hypothetical protein